VLGVIRSLAEEGRTMLLVTHELGFAYHVATRVIFLGDGTIHEQGTPDEVLKHPRRERTQAFLARHKEFSL
jgi:polar amino acid transport system ATP-binding protein